MSKKAKQLGTLEKFLKVGFWEWDEIEDRLVSCSKGYAILLNMTQKQVIENMNSYTKYMDYIHQDDRQRYIQHEIAAFQRGEGVDIEYRRIAPDGQTLYIHEVSDIETNKDGKVTTVYGYVQDITSSKLLEAQVSEKLLDAHRTEKMANIGTFEWDWYKDRLLDCSDLYAEMLGMSREEAIAHFTNENLDYEFVHPEDRERVLKIENETLPGHTYDIQYRQLIPSGGFRYVREVCEIKETIDGKLTKSLGSVQDITKQVELEEKLRAVQKLDSIGQLSAGIAHDFNNLLMIISASLELAKVKLVPDHPSQKFIDKAREAGERAANLSRQMLAFARKQPLLIRTVDLGNLLANMQDVVKSILIESVKIDFSVPKGQWFAESDSAQLEVSIINLVLNARDSMPEGGMLTLSLDLVDKDTFDTLNVNNLKSEHYIQLKICDTGTGIAQDTLDKIFDPFFTTKKVGKGTGLGLSAVYGFMKQSAGHISVKSEVGVGTEVSLFLLSSKKSSTDL